MSISSICSGAQEPLGVFPVNARAQEQLEEVRVDVLVVAHATP